MKAHMKFHTYTKFRMVIWLEFVFEHANVEIRIRIGSKNVYDMGVWTQSFRSHY